jgi:hypothetical protein
MRTALCFCSKTEIKVQSAQRTFQPTFIGRIRRNNPLLTVDQFQYLFSDIIWDQATLPVPNGGLGMRKATKVTLSAFLFSVVASQASVSHILSRHLLVVAETSDSFFNAAMKDWESQIGSAYTQSSFAMMQKDWDLPLVNVQMTKVLSAASDQVSKARLIAAAASHSTAFLQVCPCSSLGTRLDNSSIRTVIAL